MTSRPWPIPESPADGILIHHASDIHIGYRPWSYAESDHMLDDMRRGLIPKFDLSVVTGDIVDGVSATSYGVEDRYAKTWLGQVRLDTPQLLAMGNHDVRNRRVKTRVEWERVYRQKANTYVDIGGYRFISFAVDYHGFNDDWVIPATTWDWIDTTAGAASGPVVLVSHYPPAELGVSAVNYVQPPARLNELVGDRPQIVGFLCGHMHRELNDLTAAQFLIIGGRPIPVLCDISSMLSLTGKTRDQSAQIQSHSAFVTMREDLWEIRYRAHGTHGWSGPSGKRLTSMNLDTAAVTRTMG